MDAFPQGYPNVRLDLAAAYRWDDMVEVEFLSGFFQHLKKCMGKCFSEYNFFVFGSHDPDTIPASTTLEIPNKVLIFLADESSDYRSIHSVLKLQPYYHRIFKAYLPCELPCTGVHPFPLGYVKNVPHYEVKPSHLRKNDLFFSGNLNGNRLDFYVALNPLTRLLPSDLAKHFLRRMRLKPRRLLDKLTEVANPNSKIMFTNGFRQGLSSEEYARSLHDSKITFCPKGFNSAETFRHMEAMRAGCVVISEPLPNTFFYRDSPIITVSDWRSGLAIVKNLLKNPDLLLETQAATLNWWAEVCSEKGTAEYVNNLLAPQNGGVALPANVQMLQQS